MDRDPLIDVLVDLHKEKLDMDIEKMFSHIDARLKVLTDAVVSINKALEDGKKG